MKIYLDNCIFDLIINIGKKQKSPDQVAFEKIWEDHSFSFWVSPVKSLEEITNIKEKNKRDEFLCIFNKLNKTPSVPSLSVGSLSKFGSGYSTQDVDLTRIIDLIHSDSEYYEKRQLSVIQNAKGKMITNDAYHIYYSWKAGCDFLLTLDKKTLLKRVNKKCLDFKKIIGNMKIVSPQALEKLLDDRKVLVRNAQH